MTVMIEVSHVLANSKFFIKSVRWTGIRKAAAWYNAHMSLMHPATRGLPNQNVPTVVLMTDDLANRQKAEKDGIVSISGAFTKTLFDVDNEPSVFDSSQIR